MQPALLVLNFNTEAHLRQMAQAFPSFDLLYAPDAAQCEAAIAEHGTRIQAVLTIGSIGLSAAQMQRMPALRLVCALGAGYENIDVAHAQAHGIAVGNGAGTNEDCVADHAMGLLIASVRGLVRLDRATRDGVWRTAMPLPPNVSHKRLGILGMGAIGAKIAQRALGFEMEIGYHNRSPRSGLPHRYFGDLLSLALWADVLVVATPGGPGTRHLVNAQVLDALARRATWSISRAAAWSIPPPWPPPCAKAASPARAWMSTKANPRHRPNCWTWTPWCSRPMWAAGRPKPCRPRWTASSPTCAATWKAARWSRRSRPEAGFSPVPSRQLLPSAAAP